MRLSRIVDLLLRGHGGDAAGWGDAGGQDSRCLLCRLLRGVVVMLLLRMVLEDETLEDCFLCCRGVCWLG